MASSSSKNTLVFDYHTIRLLIGLIAMLFPVVIWLRAQRITNSISWSYYTDARDFFVGLLFVIGAFLISYKGHKLTLKKKEVGKFWHWLNKFWRGAIKFRIWVRKHEEDLVCLIGGIAACITALYPTALCLGEDCLPDPTSKIHYIGAFFLFSTTVYFCLVAFMRRLNEKINEDDESVNVINSPIYRRKLSYLICGWGIVITMLSLLIIIQAKLFVIENIIFWAETLALELFGIAWTAASQYVPIVTTKAERQKLFENY
jgi:hypothetical protein